MARKKKNQNEIKEPENMAEVDFAREWRLAKPYYDDGFGAVPAPDSEFGKVTLKSLCTLAGLSYYSVLARRGDPAFRLMTRVQGGPERARYFVRNAPAFLAWWSGFGIGAEAVFKWRASLGDRPLATLPEPECDTDEYARAEKIREVWDTVNKVVTVRHARAVARRVSTEVVNG